MTGTIQTLLTMTDRLMVLYEVFIFGADRISKMAA
jgi:hypothetical protein